MKKFILLFLLFITGCTTIPQVIVQPHPGEDGTVRGYKYEPEETK